MQVKPGGEYDGVNPLLDDLPTELPIKDALPLQQGLNPEDKGPMPIDEDSLEGLPWEFIINKDARQEWARMDRPFRSAPVQCNTQQIALATISHKWCEVSLFCGIGQILRLYAWCREKVIKVLQRIGQGQWEVDGNTDRRLGDVRCAGHSQCPKFFSNICIMYQTITCCMACSCACILALMGGRTARFAVVAT